MFCHPPSLCFENVSRSADKIVYAESRPRCIWNAAIAGSCAVGWTWLFLTLFGTWLLPSVGVQARTWSDWLVLALLLSVVTFTSFGAALLWWILARSLVPRELHLLPMVNTVLRRRVPFLWRSSEDTVTSSQVHSVEVIAKRLRGQWYTNACVTSFEHIPRAVETKPIDIVLCDHHYWGGIPACQALGRIAEALRWTVSQHSNNHAGVTMAAMVHLAASLPQLTCASDTHYPWLVEGADVIAGPNLRFRDGKLPVPEGPGLGVELDRDKLARARETYTKCGMRGRDDAHTMRLVEPGWERTPL